jgi:hypothetical protein
MGTSYNSSIVTDGLILNLDAANTKSYPGTPFVEVLIVGGGGGGGMDMGGGGGGGGVIQSTNVPVTVGAGMTVTVGAGGWGAPAGSGGMRGDGAGPQPASHAFTIGATDGGNSSFGGLTAIGGGHGASSYQDYSPDLVSGLKTAGSGGSGGGMTGYCYKATGGGGRTVGQGNFGGAGGPSWYSGGGGGAGAAGGSATGIPHGGVGVLSDINGTSLYWGGGGGGAAYSLSTGGNGGIGGGGGGAVGVTTGGAGLNAGSAGGGGSPGAQTNTPGGNAGANTGGGGGGGSHYNLTNAGGNGGSGIVIIRYPGPQNATGGTVTTVGTDTVHTFLSSGTFTPTSPWYGVDDLSTAKNKHILAGAPTITAGAWGLNGTTQGFTRNSALTGAATSCTVVIWCKSNDVTHMWARGNLSNGVYLGATSSNAYYQAGCGTPTYYVDLATVTNPHTPTNYLDNNWHMFEAKSVDFSAWTAFEWFQYAGFYLGGSVGCILVYSKILTATESAQNFLAFRGRYGV